MLYKNSDKSLREIGRELGVGAILEGSVRRYGGRVRIVSQLVDARTDEHIWAETYDSEMKDIFDIQSEVAERIASALKAQLSPEEKERISKKPTDNLTAYDYYLKGRDYYNRYRKQDNENAIQLFRKAVDVDPQFAAAYAGLGDAYSQRAQKFAFDEAWVDSAIEVSLKALTIDPNCAEAYKALGLAYFTKGWKDKALEATSRAIELNPNHGTAVANIGWIKFFSGKFDEALPWLKKFTELNPTRAYAHMGVGKAYMVLCDFDKAKVWTDRALELEPDLGEAHETRVAMLLMQRKFDEAVRAVESRLSHDPDGVGALALAGEAYRLSGDYALAREYYERAIEALPEAAVGVPGIGLACIHWHGGEQQTAGELLAGVIEEAEGDIAEGTGGMFPKYSLARVYALQEEKEKAYEWLEKSIEAGWPNYNIAMIDPVFESLHNDERFKQMMADLKVKVDQMRARAEEAEQS
jgi:protein kinase/serine/threonine-protein kinase